MIIYADADGCLTSNVNAFSVPINYKPYIIYNNNIITIIIITHNYITTS